MSRKLRNLISDIIFAWKHQKAYRDVRRIRKIIRKEKETLDALA